MSQFLKITELPEEYSRIEDFRREVFFGAGGCRSEVKSGANVCLRVVCRACL